VLTVPASLCLALIRLTKDADIAVQMDATAMLGRQTEAGIVDNSSKVLWRTDLVAKQAGVADNEHS
jgi:hypothetical protein